MKILVNGGTKGLGLCICKEAVRRGFDVIALGRTEPAGTFAELLADGHLKFIRTDMGAEEAIMKAVDEIRNTETYLDGIVNNAAVILGRRDNIESLNMDDMRKSMEINVIGPMLLTRELLPLVRRGTKAGIINISSADANTKGTSPTDYPYCITKTALNMFTEKLRVYLKGENIQVIAVHPGWMKTDLGGPDAPLDPMEAAVPILNMLEGTMIIEAIPSFVSRFGTPVTI